jgi:hypothetical protein
MTEILLILITAAAAKFLHYCVGSPIQGEFYTGRIFSAYGRYISKKYNDFEKKEHSRVWSKYNIWKVERDAALNEELKNKTVEESQIIYAQYLMQVEAMFNDVENNKRVNPYSSLGACPVCFSTWVSLLLSVFYIIFVPIAWYWLFLLPPAAVILSRYITVK